MKSVMKVLLILGLLAAVAPILVANLGQNSEALSFKWKLTREVPVAVRLAPVARGPITRTVEAPGKVEADVEVKISGQVMGRITKLPFREGDAIVKDALVVEMDRVQYEAEVRSAQSRIERLEASIRLSEAELTKSRRDVERFRKLVAGRAVGEVDLIDSETIYRKEQAKLAMVQAELVEAQSALRKFQDDLDRCTIHSPIKGIVSQLLAKEGEVVVVGTMNNPGTVILTISDLDTRVIRARIDENNVPLVAVGQKALIHFQNSSKLTLTGKVERINPKGTKPGGSTTTASSDTEVAIFETILSLDSPPPAVRLGMNASVEVIVDERTDVVSIPSQAVLHRRARELPTALQEQAATEPIRGPGVKDPARRYHQVVFVNVDGMARARLVHTGISDENRVEILSGLQEGEVVIAGPYRVLDKLKDGKPVVESAVDGSSSP